MDLLIGSRLIGAFCMRVVVCGVQGCQFERGDGDFESRTTGGGGSGTSPSGASNEPVGDLENIGGDWLLFIEDRVCIESSLVGDPTENIIWSSYLARVDGGNGESSLVQKSLRLCGQDLSPLPLDLRTV
ncbi:MAG: hypothetical protein VX589_13740, partial [Myxococcota bacterium]|nr:hypothetical protein [Myxococcota bacterium]